MPPRLLIVLGAWALVVAALQLYAWHALLTLPEVAQQLVLACRRGPAGPLLFVGVAAGCDVR